MPLTNAQKQKDSRARRKAKLERLEVLEGALNRAATVLEWLAENHPGCYGYEGPFPSHTPSIKIEAAAARKALGDVG